jgi:hypothetical protein
MNKLSKFLNLFSFTLFKKLIPQKIILKILPIITCNLCGYTFSPFIGNYFIFQFNEKYTFCNICSNKMKNYYYELSAYWEIKIKVYLSVFIPLFYIFILINLTRWGYFMTEVLLFFIFYMLIEPSYIIFTKNYIYFDKFTMPLISLMFLMGYYKLIIRFLILLLIAIYEMIKVNRIIIHSISI